MDESISLWNYARMDITLMRAGYTMEDIDELFQEPFATECPTKIGLEWHPSVVGAHMIEIELILGFVLSGAATVLVSKMTSDIYEWAKNSLRKVLSRKRDFVESRINLRFSDVYVTIYTFSFEEITAVMENMEIVLTYIKDNMGKKARMKIIATDIKDLGIKEE